MRSRPRTKVSTIFLSFSSAVGLAFVLMIGTQLSCGRLQAAEEPQHPASLDTAIIAAAKRHGVPERLVRRIIMRESKYNPRARNRLYWGLMQISYPTARSMGFKGTPEELLNPVVNLRYAVPYLANAFVIAGKQEDAAVRLYAAGYYNTARSRGLLDVLRTADSRPLTGVVAAQPILAANAVAQPPQSVGIFGALFGPGSQPQPQPQQTAQAAITPASVDEPSSGVEQKTANAAATTGTSDGTKIDMIVRNDGQLAPPKKWTRDGGTTQITRGAQGFAQITSLTKESDKPSRKAQRATHKFTAVAALDTPTPIAQAYTGNPEQDPRFAASPSQTAIMQATAGQPTPTAQPVAPQADASGRPIAVQPAVDVALKSTSVSEEKPTKRKRTRQTRRPKSKDDAGTQEAHADKAASEPKPVLRPAPTAVQ